MEIKPLKLQGSYEITLNPRRDDRGYFMRIYDEEIFKESGLTVNWVQENQSLSKKKGIVRGLHFQKPPHSETKLVRVVMGEILDVFVDLRKNSPTYGQWDAIKLSESNQKAVYIPKGFAHGFCTVEAPALVLYKVDCSYHPESEGGIFWNDESIGIKWPIETPSYISKKDSNLGSLKEFSSPFV
ncbi:MAG: dTDP-4-dehydrorhamnose 3,5-epimerase [Okeania sp. SIO2H7]|nr:dTDP-4-dehydrorhamnose 3,5-epimerase [Okeania sp. SIO2H7]